jgi:PAS domain S-box-containing protein
MPTSASSQAEPPRTSILLVEDAPADLLALESILKPLGQRLVRAHSGEEALTCSLQEDFAVILLDVGLPGIDGFETARQLRQQERTRHTPIIFLSGPRREHGQVLQGYSLGAVDYLLKPYEAEILRAKVTVFVDLYLTRESVKRQAALLREKEAHQARTRADLHTSEAQLRLITDTLPVLIALIGRDRRYRFVNKAYNDWLGQPHESLVGRTMVEVLGQSAYEAVHPMVEAVLTGETVTFERSATYLNGVTREFRASYVPYRTETGEIEGFVAHVMDISVLKQAERERRKAEDALHLLVEVSAALSSSIDYAATIANVARAAVPRFADGCSVYLRDGEQSIHQLAVHHRTPAKVELLREMHRRFPLSPDAPYGYARVMRTGEPFLIPELTDESHQRLAQNPEHLSMLRALGHTSLMMVPLLTTERPFGVLAFALSETPRRYGPEDLRVAQEVAQRASVALENARLFEAAMTERKRVEEANRVKDEFLATVSHELRTPLTAMLGWVQMLRSGALPPEKHARALEVVERNAKAQQQLIEDLLDVSRIITGKLRLEVTSVELVDVVAAAVEAVRPTAEAKGLRLHSILDTDIGPLLGDAQRLQQVVWNLLTNAVKFTPKGGSVHITLRRVGSSAEVQVRDSGQGISRDFLPYVFERFLQAEGGTSRKHGGLGLGLSIVRHLVELHGGTVEAFSEGEGHGALFTVRLPISPLRKEPVPALVEVAPMMALDCPPGVEGLRVLLVDDEADVREVVATMLERCGLRVSVAASTSEALDLLRRERPDVLISDIGMPEEDGYALIRKVRTLPADAGGRVPALAMTAYARMEDRTRALLAGYQMHLPKPIEPTELLVVVATLAGRLGH